MQTRGRKAILQPQLERWWAKLALRREHHTSNATKFSLTTQPTSALRAVAIRILRQIGLVGSSA